MLKVSHLCVCYGAIKALHDVSLEVRQGEIVTLLGANGAGKTTTLRAISGLNPLTSGSIEFDGQSLSAHKLAAHKIVRLGLAHSPEGRRIFGNLTVRENLDMGAYIRANGTREQRDQIESDLQEVYALFPRLKERLGQLAGTLSGGEQQMLAISRALMQRPKLLMLDEPSLGIAPVLVESIFRALVEINRKGMTMLLVEQNAAAALSIAHRAYVLETGTTTLSGPANEVARNPKVKAAYLGH
ncbi:MAG: ABC transporter ATP-binding protein [Bdellovibrionales bacterium]|nr:ABC transporter ATP-binding protein [Bdellovibrionales bacterium]